MTVRDEIRDEIMRRCLSRAEWYTIVDVCLRVVGGKIKAEVLERKAELFDCECLKGYNQTRFEKMVDEVCGVESEKE